MTFTHHCMFVQTANKLLAAAQPEFDCLLPSNDSNSFSFPNRVGEKYARSIITRLANHAVIIWQPAATPSNNSPLPRLQKTSSTLQLLVCAPIAMGRCLYPPRLACPVCSSLLSSPPLRCPLFSFFFACLLNSLFSHFQFPMCVNLHLFTPLLPSSFAFSFFILLHVPPLPYISRPLHSCPKSHPSPKNQSSYLMFPFYTPSPALTFFFYFISHHPFIIKSSLVRLILPLQPQTAQARYFLLPDPSLYTTLTYPVSRIDHPPGKRIGCG